MALAKIKSWKTIEKRFLTEMSGLPNLSTQKRPVTIYMTLKFDQKSNVENKKKRKRMKANEQ